jgi:hypothetical protein
MQQDQLALTCIRNLLCCIAWQFSRWPSISSIREYPTYRETPIRAKTPTSIPANVNASTTAARLSRLN